MRQSSQEIVISDIFGQQIGSHKIADSENEDFEEGCHVIAEKWKNMDTDNRGPMHTFVTWFYRHKYPLIQQSMLKAIRRKAGLGDPPTSFTTNASMNSVLKSRMDYKKNELPEFLDKLKSVISDQESEMERAIIGRGKYELCKHFKKMEKTEDEWFRKMTLAQRQAHMKRLSSLAVGSKVKVPLLNSLSESSKSVELSNKQYCSRKLFPQS